jgi:hypothetical protein
MVRLKRSSQVGLCIEHFGSYYVEDYVLLFRSQLAFLMLKEQYHELVLYHSLLSRFRRKNLIF